MIQEKTLPALLKKRAEQSPQHTAHWLLNKQEQWVPVTWQAFYHEVCYLAGQIKALGISKGQVVAIMAATGREWELVHHAVLMLGGIVVGIDPNETEDQFKSIIKIAAIQTLVIDRLERLNKFTPDIASSFNILTWDTSTNNTLNTNLSVLNLAVPVSAKQINEQFLDSVSPDDTATIIFTSGTTGTPKGIAYRHEQILAAVDAILQTYPEFYQQPCHLVCWLPLSNLFQRIVNLCAVGGGAQVYFVTQPQKILEYLPQINPHIFIAVPRFYEKIYQGLQTKLDQQPKAIAQILQFCLTVGESTTLLGKLFKYINRHLFKSFRVLFGNHIRYMISGSAPMPLWLLRRFNALGLLILEAYGMSENVVPIAANSPSAYQFGTVGKAMPGNQVKLADDGELLVKGLGAFSGYLGQASALDEQGYIASGDYAEIDAHGFIRLTGRKSEVFKTSTGRKIAPAGIEAHLQQLSEVEHAVIFGASKKYLVALLTVIQPCPSETAAIIAYTQQLQASLRQCVVELPDYKRPVGIVLYLGSFSVGQQELTSNLKLRRNNILQRYGTYIEQLYTALDNPQSDIHQKPVVINEKTVLMKLF